MSTRFPHTRPTQQGKRMKTRGKSIQLLLEGINDEYGVIQQRLSKTVRNRWPVAIYTPRCESKLF